MILISIIVFCFSDQVWGEKRIIPIIEGQWWRVTSNPDLGAYTSDRQQPVDFGVWQAADGTWQLWSCIRNTKCGGNTRLFYRWEGKHLTDSNWTPMGIAMEAELELGETVGGLQAPHTVQYEGLYWMAYGDWNNICFATSKDGKHFERRIQPNGKTGVFTEGPGANTRDAMLIRIDGMWHCYYTGFPGGQGFAFCRTSPDLRRWSHSSVVSYGGRIGTSGVQNECPHVVEVLPGEFVFFRNQYYGKDQRNWVYHSNNPLNFGINDDSKLVTSLEIAAPEIILHEGKYYIASLTAGLDGMRIARLRWAWIDDVGEAVFDFDNAEERQGWRKTEGNLEGVFTTSKRSGFTPRSRHFIGTGETREGHLNDGLTGVIESPPFVLDRETYTLLVSGGANQEHTFVSVMDAETGKTLARFSGKNNNTLASQSFDARPHVGKRVRIQIVDRGKDGWSHINFGGIYMQGKPEIFK
jgi:hypothetical protein